jgi:O-acetyl-ADP-ribose deacetylase (regulator of RNase III)
MGVQEDRLMPGVRYKLELCQGDITQQETDAIVNAANSSLLGGGGVDGAIHRAGGPAILEACKEIRRRRGPLPTGDAVITTGGRLRARHVIHTVGPVWQGGGQGEPELLARCYSSCLALAKRHGLGSVAFPSVSTGAYGYPVEQAATVALLAVAEELSGDAGSITLVRFVLFDGGSHEAYADAMADLATIVG